MVKKFSRPWISVYMYCYYILVVKRLLEGMGDLIEIVSILLEALVLFSLFFILVALKMALIGIARAV
ncbi:MAG: hypothetical protein QXH10_09845 [Ignisphaera sp.]|uniref:Uncharacterized protein n=1 Tax=Ignisphaera aggregans TaxID=334771 RepID=A0A7C4NMF4_9CREN